MKILRFCCWTRKCFDRTNMNNEICERISSQFGMLICLGFDLIGYSRFEPDQWFRQDFPVNTPAFSNIPYTE